MVKMAVRLVSIWAVRHAYNTAYLRSQHKSEVFFESYINAKKSSLELS